LAGQRSPQKVVPADVFRLSDRQITLFLRHLWATDGCTFLRRRAKGPVGRIYYATSSEVLASQVQHLLNRFEIRSRIKRTHKNGYADGFHVLVSGKADQLRFAEHIGGPGGENRERLETLVARLAPLRTSTNVDALPAEVWRQVQARMGEQGVSQRQMCLLRGTRYGGVSHSRFAPSRASVASHAEVLESQALRDLASSDVFWDEIRSIEPDGEEDVYDMSVPGTHNFVANGIVVHNSIEQDADVVTFIYRDEKYNPDTDKRGVADIIVAKHRNGPTGQVQLLFLERTTKFLDLEVFRA
jgi:replicative DNA helicase